MDPIQNNFSKFPQLETQRLILRQLEETDAPEMFELRSHPEVMKYIDRPRPRTVLEADLHIQLILEKQKKGEGINWAIVPKGHVKMVGTIGLFGIEPENFRAEIGYTLMPEFHRKGLMSEALPMVCDFGFKNMCLHTIFATVHHENSASIKILEKTGFEKEGHFKASIFHRGSFRDLLFYTLFEDQYLKK